MTAPTTIRRPRAAGHGRPRGRRPGRKLTFDQLSFMVGVPRSPAGDLPGLRDLAVRPGLLLLDDRLDRLLAERTTSSGSTTSRKLFARRHLHARRCATTSMLAIVVPLVTIVARPRHRVAGDGRRLQQGQHPRASATPASTGRLVLPVRRPGHRHRPHLGADVRPVQRPAQRHPHHDRPRAGSRTSPGSVSRAPRDAAVDVRDHLGLRRLLHGAVHRRDQGHPGRDLRGGPHRRRRPVPDGHLASPSR